MRTPVYFPGMTVQGFLLLELLTYPGSNNPKWKALCPRCKEECSFFLNRIYGGKRQIKQCRECSRQDGFLSRKPRKCEYCGTEDLKKFGKRKRPATRCMACSRSQARYGVHSECGKPHSPRITCEEHLQFLKKREKSNGA